MKRLFLALALGSTACLAHEVRPAYLEMQETAPGEFAVTWKTPMLGEARLALEPLFSGGAAPITPKVTRSLSAAAIETWTMHAPALRGQRLRIANLEATMTDVLVRIAFADGSEWTGRLTPRAPAATVPTHPSRFAVALTYLRLGVEHILGGIDHLLFVLALLILTRGAWRLVKTVTAFTVAHSITLAAATLGLVRVPQAPVEAAIALSIVFVAAEILRARQGRDGIAARLPWLVAFLFGLLHGFGFAGALAETGLPPDHIPLALAFFNAGVEVGQVLFVAAVLGLVAAARRWLERAPRWLELVPPYAIGTTAMFWVIQRVAAF